MKWSLYALFAFGLFLPLALHASEPDLKKQVVDLIKQLDSSNRGDRDKAEEKLLELGAEAVDHLPEISHPNLSAEQRRRIRRILPKLWEKQLLNDVAGTKVQFSESSMPLSKVFQELQKQTGNRISDMRSDFNQPITNPTVELPQEPIPFWKALNESLTQAGMGYYHFSDDRSIGVQNQAEFSTDLVQYAGAFQFALQRVVLDHRFNQQTGPTCGLTFDVVFEPRIKPVMLEVRLENFVAKDDKGNTLAFTGPQRIPLSIDSMSYHLPITLTMEAPDRTATKIAEFSGELTAWLPSHTDEFVFENFHEGKPQERSTSTLKVSLQSVTDDQGLWTAPVIIEQIAELIQVDSYLQAALENEIYLEEDDGSRFSQNGGLSTFGEEPGKMGIEYLFADAPKEMKDYKLVLRVPTGLTSVPIKFSYKDIPLP